MPQATLLTTSTKGKFVNSLQSHTPSLYMSLGDQSTHTRYLVAMTLEGWRLICSVVKTTHRLPSLYLPPPSCIMMTDYIYIFERIACGTVCCSVARLAVGGVEMGGAEGWVVVREGGEGGGGEKERSEGDPSTQPCL